MVNKYLKLGAAVGERKSVISFWQAGVKRGAAIAVFSAALLGCSNTHNLPTETNAEVKAEAPNLATAEEFTTKGKPTKMLLTEIAEDWKEFRSSMYVPTSDDSIALAQSFDHTSLEDLGLVALARNGCKTAKTAFGEVNLSRTAPVEERTFSRICLVPRRGPDNVEMCDAWASVNRQQAKTMVCRAKDGSPIEYVLSLPGSLAADYPAATALSPHCAAKHKLMMISSTCSTGG